MPTPISPADLPESPGGEAAAHFRRGLALAQAKHNREAALAFRRALELDSRYEDAWVELGSLLARCGQPRPAAGALRHALKLNPDNLHAGNNLGIVLRAVCRADEAVTLYRRLLSAHPQGADLHYNLGLALRDADDRAGAVAALRAAVRCQPDFVAAWHNLAAALREQGRGEEAAQAYRRVLELDPANENARHLLAALSGETTPTAPRGYVEPLFDAYAPRFDRDLTRDLGYAVPAGLRRAVDAVEPSSARPQFTRGLDLGCGTGLVAAEFRGRVQRLDGVDVSARMLALARARNLYDTLEHVDLVDALRGAQPGGYDLLLAADVFIYVGELVASFRGAAGALAGGGLFAFSVEHGVGGPWVLRPSGRYAHSDDYVRGLAAEHGFQVALRQDLDIRADASGAVPGSIWVLRKHAASDAPDIFRRLQERGHD